MIKPRFNPEINWGQIFVAVSFIFALIPLGIAWGTEIKVMRKDVDRLQAFELRQQAVNEKLADSQTLIARTLAETKILVDEHIKRDSK